MSPTPQANCVTDDMIERPPTSVLIFTQNITRRPIKWDPTRQRPTQEAIHAIHSALHFALDPCTEHPDEACSFEVVDADASEPNAKTDDRILVVPRVVDMSPPVVCQTERSKIDVTAKLFLGRIECSDETGVKGRDARDYIDDALRWLEAATCVKEVERFIISLPGVKWEGDEASEKDGMSEVDTLAKIWPYVAQKPALRTLGVADFSAAHVQRLLELTEEGTRRLTINQVNLDQDGTAADSLTEIAKREQVELLTHSDDLGTKQQLIGLLNEFEDRLPLPKGFGQKVSEGGEGLESLLRVEWVLKYTILIRDRGLVADKGYIAAAAFP